MMDDALAKSADGTAAPAWPLWPHVVSWLPVTAWVAGGS